MRNEKRNKKSFLVIPHSTLRIPHWRDMHFRDRAEAGRLLAQALKKYQKQDGVVYALPRGGGGRGVEVARALARPLDLLIPRKIGHPLQPEYAICAVVESGEMVCKQQEVARVDPQWFRRGGEAARQEARRRREP